MQLPLSGTPNLAADLGANPHGSVAGGGVSALQLLLRVESSCLTSVFVSLGGSLGGVTKPRSLKGYVSFVNSFCKYAVFGLQFLYLVIFYQN